MRRHGVWVFLLLLFLWHSIELNVTETRIWKRILSLSRLQRMDWKEKAVGGWRRWRGWRGPAGSPVMKY